MDTKAFSVEVISVKINKVYLPLLSRIQTETPWRYLEIDENKTIRL